MRIRPPAAVLVALLPLAACSLGHQTTDTAPAPTPTISAPASSTPPTPTLTPTPSAAAPTTSAPAPTKSASASTKPSSASPSTTDAASAPSGKESVTTYDDLTVHLPLSGTAVAGAPAGLVTYLRAALNSQWKTLGGSKACESAPQIAVQKISSLGFAMVNRSINPGLKNCSVNDPSGYQTILGVKNGAWTQLLELQDAPACSQVKKLGIPKSIYGQCY